MKVLRLGILLCVISTLALHAGNLYQNQDDEFLELDRISDRVIVIKSPCVGMINNIVAINSKKGIVVVDTHITPSFASLIRKKIEEEFQRQDFAYVINTHGHADHTLGNQEFSDTVIIGHEACAADMKMNETGAKRIIARCKRILKQLNTRLEKAEPGSDEAITTQRNISIYNLILKGLESDLKLTLPTMTFSDKLYLDLGDLTLNLYHFGYSHSKGDILILCPEEGILMTGDLFTNSGNLYIDSERMADFPRWMAGMELGLDPANKIHHVIPGHYEYIKLKVLEQQLERIKQKQLEFAGKESSLFVLKEVYAKEGVEAAVARLKAMRAQPEKYFFLHPELDQWTYRLMLQKKHEDALEIFLVLAEYFPEAENSFDSLGEVYIRLKKPELAMAAFEKVLELNPKNYNAKNRLAELKKK